MILKVSTLNKLNNFTIHQILKLKNSYWSNGLLSQRIWFKKNVKKNDLHILLFHKKNLIGYVLLRIGKFFLNQNSKKLKKFLYFDTLIIRKDYRGLKLSLKILHKSQKISKDKKLPMFLICKKKTIRFYKKQGWKLLDKKKINLLDHIFTTNAMIYCSMDMYKKISDNKVFLSLNSELNINNKSFLKTTII